MPLVNMKDMLDHAYRHNYAVGAFDLVNLEFLEGVLSAAERCRAPVILSLAETHFPYFDFDLLVSAVETAARRASVPVSVHLNQGRVLPSAIHAIKRGCNGVMVDASDRSWAENIALTREVVAIARACGVAVGGKLGQVPAAEAKAEQMAAEPPACTTVAEARTYVERTGVDFFAVAIGTTEGRVKGKPKINWQRLKQINEALAMPLATHGGAGLDDEQFRRLVANGVAKISYFTGLADAAHGRLLAAKASGSFMAAMQSAREAIEQGAEHYMRVWGAAGRAAEVLEQCRPWHPIEQVITYETDGLDESTIEAIMAEGRRVLDSIPGIREVCSGEAVRDGERCRYNWLVRFCSPAAIQAYREHPEYVAFAGRRFRPAPGASVGAESHRSFWRDARTPPESPLWPVDPPLRCAEDRR